MDPTIKGLIKGDKVVIGSLYDVLLPKVISWIMSNGGTKEDSYDLFQDALESIIIRAHKSSMPERMDIHAFTMQIVKNKWIDKTRRNKLEEKVRLAQDNRYNHESPWEEEIVAAEEAQGKYRLMKHTFTQLSPLCQDLLQMIMADKKTEVIVDKLGFNNANTMYRRKFACINSWKSFVKSINQKKQ